MTLKEAIIKVIDEEGLAELVGVDLMDGVVKKKLDELVLDTNNSIDDALVAMIYPIIKDAVMKFITTELGKLK